MKNWQQLSESVIIKSENITPYRHITPRWKEFLIRLFKGQEYLERREKILSKKLAPLRLVCLKLQDHHGRKKRKNIYGFKNF